MRCYAVLLSLAALATAGSTTAQTPPDPRTRIEALTADLRDLARRYDAPMSNERRTRLRQRLEQEQDALRGISARVLEKINPPICSEVADEAVVGVD